MSIEVRQISIHSRVGVPDKADSRTLRDRERERERLKEEILAECRQMMLELLRTDRER